MLLSPPRSTPALLLAVALALGSLAAPLAPARAADLPEAQKAAAEELLALLGFTRSFEQMRTDMTDQIDQVLVRDNPEQAEVATAILTEEMDLAMVEVESRALDLGTRIWARYYSTEELQGLVEFYSSPLGRKTIAVQPEMFGTLVEETGKLRQEFAGSLAARLRVRLQEADLKVPPEL